MNSILRVTLQSINLSNAERRNEQGTQDTDMELAHSEWSESNRFINTYIYIHIYMYISLRYNNRETNFELILLKTKSDDYISHLSRGVYYFCSH